MTAIITASNGAATTAPQAATITLEYQRPKDGRTATLTAKVGDEVLHVESLDPTRSKSRQRFADAVCEGRPGIYRGAIDTELLRIAAEVAGNSGEGAGDNGKATVADDMPELDTSLIVRPERFITPDVSGLAVPAMVAVGERPAGQWRLYLRWRDGRRQVVRLPRSLNLPACDKQTADRRLWIHPTPADPTASLASGWSQSARKAWLKNTGGPAPDALFAALCERFAHYLDMPQTKGPGTTATLALWVMLTYLFSAFDAVPYLYIGGRSAAASREFLRFLAGWCSARCLRRTCLRHRSSARCTIGAGRSCSMKRSV